MGVTLRVSACRKEGTANYGSIGAECAVDGIEIPSGADPATIVAIRDHWYGFCEVSIESQLAALRGGPSAAPAPPVAQQPHKERINWPSADHGEAARPTANGTAPPARASRAVNGGANGNGNRDGVPRSGGALVARLKEMDERIPQLGVFRHVVQWGKAHGNSSRVNDWSENEVKVGWSAAQDFLEALQKSDSLQNGY